MKLKHLSLDLFKMKKKQQKNKKNKKTKASKKENVHK